MTVEMQEAIIEESTAELRSLLSEHMGCIAKSMQSSLAEHTGDSQFKYPVSLGLVITPFSREQSKVVAKISYSVKHSDETDGRMVDPAQQKFSFADGGKDAEGNRVINCNVKGE